jgi:hypothetical protein
MDLRKSMRYLLCHLVGAAMLVGTAAVAADLASQSSEGGGVTIDVKPLDVAAGAAKWSFQVSLNTHSQDLSDDLARTAFIVNRAGKKNELPIGWEGDVPGGHHRKGVLSFKALTPLPAAIELRIQRAGEKAPRVFRWDLDCPCNDPKMHAS